MDGPRAATRYSRRESPMWIAKIAKMPTAIAPMKISHMASIGSICDV